MRENGVTRAVQPAVTVVGNAGLLHIGDQLSAFVACYPVTGRGLDERQVTDADHPQRATHREVLDEGAPLVQRGVEVGHRETGPPGPQGQVRRGRIGGVQADERRDGIVNRGR